MDKPKVESGASKAVCCKIGVLFAANELYAAEGNLQSTIETAKKLFGVADVKIVGIVLISVC